MICTNIWNHILSQLFITTHIMFPKASNSEFGLFAAHSSLSFWVQTQYIYSILCSYSSQRRSKALELFSSRQHCKVSFYLTIQLHISCIFGYRFPSLSCTDNLPLQSLCLDQARLARNSIVILINSLPRLRLPRVRCDSLRYYP